MVSRNSWANLTFSRYDDGEREEQPARDLGRWLTEGSHLRILNQRLLDVRLVPGTDELIDTDQLRRILAGIAGVAVFAVLIVDRSLQRLE